MSAHTHGPAPRGFFRMAPVAKWPTLLATVLVTMLAVGFVARALIAEDEVVARAGAGESITLPASHEGQTLQVLVRPVVASPTDVDCRQDGSVRVSWQAMGPSTASVEGQEYIVVGTTSSRWAPGEFVLCDGGGITEVVIATDHVQGARIAALLLGWTPLVFWPWTALVFWAARTEERRSEA